jgi:hypothetical protein
MSGITIALTVAGCVLLVIALLAFVGLFAAGLGLTEHGPRAPWVVVVVVAMPASAPATGAPALLANGLGRVV